MEVVWSKNPDWRLGQLIFNITGRSNLFYVEDDDLENLLKKYE